ncbi:hypothetical protein SKAU_G00271920 [Synaphobranchus kaupii]|uniref:Uncharacterized protein n=1 Tax=Synaphobranchus kaupii TaxID=118154 RepID=A0A9Q1F0H2_SYNKA|nr:hypothetical protein SKAU_G00271920 [Synaphobranchus kaupii]
MGRRARSVPGKYPGVRRFLSATQAGKFKGPHGPDCERGLLARGPLCPIQGIDPRATAELLQFDPISAESEQYRAHLEKL